MNVQKGNQTCKHTEQRPCEHTAGRCPSSRRERGLRGNQTCRHHDLGLPASRTVRNQCLPYQLPVLWFALWLCELRQGRWMCSQAGALSILWLVTTERQWPSNSWQWDLPCWRATGLRDHPDRANIFECPFFFQGNAHLITFWKPKWRFYGNKFYDISNIEW